MWVPMCIEVDPLFTFNLLIFYLNPKIAHTLTLVIRISLDTQQCIVLSATASLR